MGSVRVRAEHAAGHQDLDGRLLNVHGADLATGGLGAQQEFIRQIEGILHIAGGVILGHVQAGKVVVIVLDLREGAHRKTHAGEHVDDLVGDQGQRVQAAHGAGLGGQGDVHRLGGVAGSKLCLLHGLGGGIVVCLHLLLEFVDDLAHRRALFRRNGAQILHQGRDLAVFAEVFLPEGSQRLLAGHLTKAFSGLLGQLIDHCLHGFSLLYSLCSWSGVQQKSSVPCPTAQAKGTKL